MKHTKSTIPKKLRAEMQTDEEYKSCMLFGQHDHFCGGRITKEHAIRIGGKNCQERWAIISLCARGHAVDEYQDAGTMNKEMNEWVALSRATDQDILAAYGETSKTPLCKANILFLRKNYLIGKYGAYKLILPHFEPFKVQNVNFWSKSFLELARKGQLRFSEQSKNTLADKKFWYPVSPELREKIQACIAFHQENEDIYYTPLQMIGIMIREYSDEINRLKNQ